MKLTDEEIDFLVGMTQCLFDYGMVNWTNEDYDKFKKIKRKLKNGS